MTNLLTAKQVKEKLNIGESTVYKLIYTGELPAVRIRSARLIRDQDVEAYIERMMTSAQEKA